MKWYDRHITNSMNMYQTQRLGIFIDAQNIYHTSKMLFNARVNYKTILEEAIQDRQLVRAFAYVIKSETQTEEPFFKALKDLGIETREKDLQIFFSGAKKADWDVGLAMDIVRLTEKLDVIVLVSGDGDFTEVLRYVKSRGVKAEVMAFQKSTSALLIEESDVFTDLAKDPKRFLIQSAGRRRVNKKK